MQRARRRMVDVGDKGKEVVRISGLVGLDPSPQLFAAGHPIAVNGRSDMRSSGTTLINAFLSLQQPDQPPCTSQVQ